MYSVSRLTAVLLVIFSLSAAAPGFSQTGGGDGQGDGQGESDGDSGGLSDVTTETVVGTITQGLAKCQRLERVYRFDCYRQTYRLAASRLNGLSDYRDARKALASVEMVLDEIMKQHADPTVGRKRQGLRTYRAIKPAAIPRATAQLDLALDRAETILLRAPERSRKQYARIAEAVNSNKVLLRSRLYPDGDQLVRTAFV